MPSEAAGDKARRAIEAQGLLYMPDVEEDVQRRLSLLELRSQVALAACCALRLMRLHRQLPLHRQREFTLTWGPTLDQVWEALVGDSAQLQILRVRRALDAFRVSPYNHSDGQDGPDDADEDAAAAAIYTAEALCEKDARAACWATSRLLNHALESAVSLVEPGGAHVSTTEHLLLELAHPLVQADLRLLLRALAVLESSAGDTQTLLEVRRILEAG